ncbi:uncharacterized protein N0V89_010634 [Didymosphaeria variabile]|uniref:Rhodopsin domain-containing protein n=1 Tax=Didymosphaeria variabile TaxID=1932322 RepID=A0A9W9C7B8_9PLEO|nr:uncharacterized protein N0V89_010634 [Didymosphaeria variabile]KAJ4346702.1 hypothetical protein N0V89_010634 [Didymosphaeria variabile]
MHLTLEPIDPTDFDPNLLVYVRKYSYGVNICYMLMYTSLWCVKLSFLLFFYRLGPRLIQGMKWHWWGVAIFTMLAYGATFATYPYMCSFGTYEQIMQPYCTAEQTLSFVNMKVNVVLDVVTDILIMTIPLNILWRSRIPLRQSLALAGVFSLVLITITFAIVRAALSTIGVTKQMDSPWVLIWSGAESNIAIVVASIGSFRMLFVQNRRVEGRQRDEVGARRRRMDKSTTMAQGASVEEMASVGGSTEWTGVGTVESTLPAPSNRPSLRHRRNASSRLNLQSENMGLSSFTGIRRASETYVNTRRNRVQAGRSSSSSLSSISSTTAQSTPDCAPSPVSEGKKVRFVHPVVTAVIKSKIYEMKVRFAEPLTSIPPRSKEERAVLCLPGTPYQKNSGPICDNAPGHYARMCMCFTESFPEFSEEGYTDPFTFKYNGRVYADDNKMFRGATVEEQEEGL